MREDSSIGAGGGAAGQMLSTVTDAITTTVGPALVGLYLCGSLATADFDEHVSDIDLLAVLSTDISSDLAALLERMHDDVASANPSWRGRIEVVYVSASGLANFRVAPARIHIISAGEPFHVISAGPDWTITWYPARRAGIALVGPPASEVIPPTSFDEYADAVRKYALRFTDRVPDDATRGSQAYAVLTMCRALYTLLHREAVSKLRAANWAQNEFPESAGLIRDAISWREHQWDVPQADGAATIPAVRRFVAEMAELVYERNSETSR
jgi:predicted nucleotidyltransferase